MLAQHGEGSDDLLLIVRRVEALGKFLATDDGKSLLAGVKRASNILRIEEKKDGKTYHGRPDPHLYLQPEERALAAAIHAVKEAAAKAVAQEDYEGAMAAIAKLRSDVDAFFEKVTVNVEMADRRENRLKLLERDPRGDARGCGFFQDRGVSRHHCAVSLHGVVFRFFRTPQSWPFGHLRVTARRRSGIMQAGFARNRGDTP